MNVVVSCEFRFFRTPDKQVWTTSSFKYDFWLRYLTAFKRVTVVARIKEVAHAESDWQLASGDRVNFFALPHYIGLADMAKKMPRLLARLRQAVKLDGTFILRVPSQTAMLMTKLMPANKQYALEVIGDPFDVFSAGVGNAVNSTHLKIYQHQKLTTAVSAGAGGQLCNQALFTTALST